MRHLCRVELHLADATAISDYWNARIRSAGGRDYPGHRGEIGHRSLDAKCLSIDDFPRLMNPPAATSRPNNPPGSSRGAIRSTCRLRATIERGALDFVPTRARLLEQSRRTRGTSCLNGSNRVLSGAHKRDVITQPTTADRPPSRTDVRVGGVGHKCRPPAAAPSSFQRFWDLIRTVRSPFARHAGATLVRRRPARRSRCRGKPPERRPRVLEQYDRPLPVGRRPSLSCRALDLPATVHRDLRTFRVMTFGHLFAAGASKIRRGTLRARHPSDSRRIGAAVDFSKRPAWSSCVGSATTRVAPSTTTASPFAEHKPRRAW